MKQEHEENLERDAANSLLALIGNNENGHSQASYSTESEDESFSSSSSITSHEPNEMTSTKKSNKKESTTMLLPKTLMTLLDDPSNSDIITFLPDGTSFAILQPTVFALGLMPKHFNMVNYKSFVRKLNRWGFRQVTDRNGAHCEVYQHPLFRRGEWGLCRKMKCLRGDHRRPSSISISRASSPTSVAGQAPNLHQSSSCSDVAGERKQRVHLSLAKELQDRLAPSVTTHDQSLKRREPRFVSQEVLDQATNEVLGAAFEVLARDKDHAPKAQFPLHLPAMSGIRSLANPALLNCSLNRTSFAQGQIVLPSLVGAGHTGSMIDANALSEYVYLQQLKRVYGTN